MMALGHRGAVGLMMSLATLAVLLIVSATTVTSLRSIKRESLYQHRLSQAQFLAESGAEDALKQLSEDSSWRAGFSNKAMGSGTYTVALSTNTRPWVTSTGYAGSLSLLGRAFRTVRFRAETPPIPRMAYGIMAEKAVNLKGDSTMDSYNSETDPDPASFSSSAVLWGNASVNLTRKGYALSGDLYYFSGAAPADDVVSGTVTQSTYTQTLSSTAVGGYTTDNENLTGLSPAWIYNLGNRNVHVTGPTNATIRSGVYYFGKLDVDGTLTLNITNGPVVIFLTGDFNVSGKFLNPTKIPGNLVIYGRTAAKDRYTINALDKFHGVIQAKLADFTLHSEFYGAIATEIVTFESTAKFHQDLSLLRATVNTVRVFPGTWSALAQRQ